VSTCSQSAVAPRPKNHQPERPNTGPAPLAATALWEQVLTPVGDSEASWGWESRGSAAERCSSSELAARCVEQLHAAFLEGRDAV
jgi:hypothetical protein